MTVFDPDPMFNHPFIDLARAMVIGVSRCRTREAADQLEAGYFGSESYNKRALYAAVVIEAYLKFPYWNDTGQEDRLKDVCAYLGELKHLV
jgi:hypothetical protein